MGNTVLRPINSIAVQDYYVDTEGFLYRKLLGRPRDTGNTCYMLYEESWFILLKPNRSGKYKNYLSHKTTDTNIRVHRAVLSTFKPISNCEELQVNHIDRNTFNNHIDNLEWVTNKENTSHRFTVDRPDTIENMFKEYTNKWENRHARSDKYKVKAIGGTQIYDKDLIIELLYNTRLTLPQIALVTGTSLRAVRYWQEKEKVSRYGLLDIVVLLQEDNPNITVKELAIRANTLVTSIHAILRKVKCNDYRKGKTE